MKNITVICLSAALILALYHPAKSDGFKSESFDKAGWVELNGVRYTGNFYAKGIVEYNERTFLWDIKTKYISAVYITDYKFCSPEVRYRVNWISLGGKQKLYKVDSSSRINKNSPLYTTTIIGHQVWLEFQGPEYGD